MGKVLKFEAKKQQKQADPDTIKLCQFADDVDEAVRHYLVDQNLDPRDVIGVLSHRLGTILNMVESKDELWAVCEKVLRKQAKIKESV